MRPRVSALALAGALVPMSLAAPASAAPDPAPPGSDLRTTLLLAPATVAPDLRSDLLAADGDERVEALVVMEQVPDLGEVRGRPAKVVGRLRSTATSSQQGVVDAVRSGDGRVEGGFWLKNMLLVEATPETLADVAHVDGVDRLIPNFTLSLPADSEPEVRSEAPAGPQTWGLERIGAGRVQDELGVTGAGVRVAVLDTGVDVQHPDLAGALVTDDPSDPTSPGGWMEFDAAGRPVTSSPRDSAEHGTHVAGTVVGGDASGTRIGVAPDAELMAAMVIPGGQGTLTQVIAGMEWALAPYDADGQAAGRDQVGHDVDELVGMALRAQ
jgi:subtilisin family serine protease